MGRLTHTNCWKCEEYTAIEMPKRIGFRVAQVTSEEEGYRGSQLVEVGPQAKGWMSDKYCIFPVTLTLQLDTRTTVEKLQIMGHPWAVTTKLEIWVGDVPKGQEVVSTKAYFMKIGEFPMENNESNDYTARQLQCVEINQGARPVPVSFVRFVLHKNHTNRKNQYNQVGLSAVNIIGTPKTPLPSGPVNDLESDVFSEYDDLAFLMYTDKEVSQIISKLEKKKFEAVSTERFEYAKKIKSAIGELREAGLILGSLEMEKQIFADTGQYDEAKEKKIQMDEFRVEVYKSLEITDLLELQGGPRNH